MTGELERRRVRRGAVLLVLLVAAGSFAWLAQPGTEGESTVLADQPASAAEDSSPALIGTGETSSTTGSTATSTSRVTTTKNTAPVTTGTTPPEPAATTTTTTSPTGPETTTTTTMTGGVPDCGSDSPPSLPNPTDAALSNPRRTPGAVLYVAWEPGSPERSSVWMTGPTGSEHLQFDESDGADSSPDMSGDESRLVWVHNSQVVTMDYNGRNIRQLTNCDARFAEAAWSPDGTMIAATVRNGGSVAGSDHALLVMRGDGAEQRFVESPGGPVSIDASISWTPDGRILARSTAVGAAGFFLVDIDAGSMTRIYSGEGTHPQRSIRADGDSTPMLVEAGSPKIAFIENGHLVTVRFDGSDRRVRVSPGDLPAGARIVGGPRWTYNGVGITFTVQMGEASHSDLEVWAIDIDGGNLRNLTNDTSLCQSVTGTT